MGWIEDRALVSEAKVENLYRRLQDMLAQLNGTRQQLRGAYQQAPGGGPGGGGGTIYLCVPTANIGVASGLPPSGTPTALTGQAIYSISGGAYGQVTANGTVYNASPTKPVTSGILTFLGANPDGSYTANGQTC